jgi:CBS domain-containing protein
MPTVRDVMTTDVVCCSPFDSLVEAAQLMRDDNVGDVLIVENERLIGVVTERDLVVYGIASGEDIASLVTYDVYSNDPVTIDVDASVDTSLAVLHSRGVQRAAVTEGGRLVGVVWLADLTTDRRPVLVGVSVD